MNSVIKVEELEGKIRKIRGQRVLLDSDVANVYGVETKRINEAVRNNPDKFPESYILELSSGEWDTLKSKYSTLVLVKVTSLSVTPSENRSGMSIAVRLASLVISSGTTNVLPWTAPFAAAN